jgi:Fic family protein
MGIYSWVKTLFRTKTETLNGTAPSISILRTETPERVIETRIKPIKIPTIVDVGERLGLINKHLIELKNEMATRSWFKSEYEDTGTEVLDRLEVIENTLNTLQTSLNQITKGLSNFTKGITKIDLSKTIRPKDNFTIPNRILEIINQRKRIRYKDIAVELRFSDPTLSKYLKILCNENKLKRIKEGKAVYYEPI